MVTKIKLMLIYKRDLQPFKIIFVTLGGIRSKLKYEIVDNFRNKQFLEI